MKLHTYLRSGILALAAACATPHATAQSASPMSLAQCIAHAKAHNINVQRLHLMLQQRQDQVQAAKDNRLPTVSANSSATLSLGRGLNAQNTYVSQNTQNIGINAAASLPLFTGHRLSSAIAQARIDLSTATAELAKAHDDLSLNVAQAYLQALYQSERISTAQQQLAMSQTLKARFDSLFTAGRIAEYEVIQAQAQITTDQLALVEAQNDYALSILELSQLLELPKPEELSITPPTDSIPTFAYERPEAIFATAAQQRPAIEAERHRVASAKEHIRQARAGYFPSISLNAGLGSSYYHVSGAPNTAFDRQLRNNFGQNIGVTLSYNIFDAFATRHAVRQARWAHQDQTLQLTQALKTLYTEIQRAYYNAIAAQSKYTASLAAESSAAEALHLATKKYEFGRGHHVEYAEARTKWSAAQTQALQAKYEYIFRHKILGFYAGQSIE